MKLTITDSQTFFLDTEALFRVATSSQLHDVLILQNFEDTFILVGMGKPERRDQTIAEELRILDDIRIQSRERSPKLGEVRTSVGSLVLRTMKRRAMAIFSKN